MSPEKVFIIAEAGVNHNGSLETAKKLVDAAARAGADAVKFQTFKAELLTAAHAPKAHYQKKWTGTGESQLEMLRKLELSSNDHQKLIKHCRKRKIIFLSSPFDEASAGFLRKMGMRIFKIPSGEITNFPLLREIASFGRPVILSTGMSTMTEVSAAVAELMRAGLKKSSITVLQCNTEYPTCCRDVNLRAMPAMGKALGVRVGYSDHTSGIEIPVAAAALGASVIEKHFTLDRNLPGPDHRASLEPDELRQMVISVRNVGIAMGDGIKRPSRSEIKNRPIVRKSIVAARQIMMGETFSPENLTAKRPGTGISPAKWDYVIGKKALRNFTLDEKIVL